MKTGLLRATLTLLTGSVLAHALPLLLGPLLTRLYTPQDFGQFALLWAVATNLAVVGCARYEFALPLEKSPGRASVLMALCARLLLAVSATSVAIAAVLVLWQGTPLAWLLPLAVLAGGTTQWLTLWATRSQRFGLLSMARLVQQGWRIADPRLGNEPRPVRLSDIAVLARTNGTVTAIASTLRRRRVACATEQPGLLGQPESVLVIACLRRLNDDRDSLATAEIISLADCEEPEVWLTDRLAWIARSDPDGLWKEEAREGGRKSTGRARHGARSIRSAPSERGDAGDMPVNSPDQPETPSLLAIPACRAAPECRSYRARSRAPLRSQQQSATKSAHHHQLRCQR